MEHRQITVIADSHIPCLGELERHQGVRLLRLEPSAITREAVADADALIVRTRTRCDAALLAGSRVSFVGTATIGLDHIDREWCGANGIEWTNAPGCNAPAVAQYVLSSLLAIHGAGLSRMTLGIIGVGHVGSLVARWAEGLGIRVLRHDPPRAEREGADGFVDRATLLDEADIITLHTPLTRTGRHATYHLADDTMLRSCRRGITLVNSARGPVTDTGALLRALDNGQVAHAVIDTWEGEPDAIDIRLLRRADFATPHIAGYSANGKRRATRMVLEKLYRHFGLGTLTPDPGLMDIPATVTAEALTSTYDPTADTEALRSNPAAFEALRNSYDLRPEPR